MAGLRHMLIRILQIGIVAFWLSTVVWLVRDIRKENNFLLAETNVDFVLDTLYNWSDSARLDLFENGESVGGIDISASKDITDPDNAPRNISITGRISGLKREEKTKSVRGRASFTLNKDREMITTEISIEEVSANGMSFFVRMDDLNPGTSEDGAAIHLLVENGDLTMFEFDGTTSELTQGFSGGPGMFPGMAFLPAMPFSMEAVDGEPSGGLASAANFFQDLEAFQGTKDFDGRPLSVFMLQKTFSKNQSLRLYLTEAGEPLKFETDIGFEAISDILVPN